MRSTTDLLIDLQQSTSFLHARIIDYFLRRINLNSIQALQAKSNDIFVASLKFDDKTVVLTYAPASGFRGRDAWRCRSQLLEHRTLDDWFERGDSAINAMLGYIQSLNFCSFAHTQTNYGIDDS